MKLFVKIILVSLVLGIFLVFKFDFIGPSAIMPWQEPEPDYIPLLTGENLLGEEHIFPRDFKKPLTLLVIGFKREHQTPINTWISTYEKGDLDKEKLDFSELPIIYEVGMLKRLFINNGMKLGIPDPEQLKRTVTLYMDRQNIFDALKMDVESIYTLLVQQDGKIIWRSKGMVSAEKIEALQSLITSYQPLSAP